eukprot:TRINITY_DN76220_c0_g1_i1.p1 TRINITY_DN76220_c0_g1~~TRINITY_DN76220_c0_g1_i1.p1  ORF type:complete len:156 (-),score=18.43 TRINITY_DN76220_c0_g1_i1:427-858(-)
MAARSLRLLPRALLAGLAAWAALCWSWAFVAPSMRVASRNNSSHSGVVVGQKPARAASKARAGPVAPTLVALAALSATVGSAARALLGTRATNVGRRFFGGGGSKEVAGSSVYDFKVNDIDGKEVSLSQYEGKVLLIVNVASK